MDKWDLFKTINKDILDVLKTESEWEFYIENQKLKIKIQRDDNNKYRYSLSHYLKTPGQADEYKPSSGAFETEEEALRDALCSLFLFYRNDEDHNNYKWIKNTDY